MSQVEERWHSLEERLRVVEGGSSYELKAVDLPAKFKTPEFDKYKGSSYPRVHLVMYCRKMAVDIHDNKILVHCFQDNLTGAALGWYVSLERGHIKMWRDLAEAFIKQYKYNEDMALDRSWLQGLVKKEQEGFKEYAKQWHELAVQIQSLITEREMVTMFIDTLPSSYYDKVIGNAASNFADLVTVGERIELGIRRGRFAQESGSGGLSKKPIAKKKKGEANAVIVGPSFPQGRDHQSKADVARQEKATSNIDSNPRVLHRVVALVARAKAHGNNSPQALEPPYPRSYDPNARCDYHGGVVGHATKRTKGQTSKGTRSRPTRAQKRNKPPKWGGGLRAPTNSRTRPEATCGRGHDNPTHLAQPRERGIILNVWAYGSLTSPAQSYSDEGENAWAGGVNIPQGPRVESRPAEIFLNLAFCVCSTLQNSSISQNHD
ncbi:hypothetical protein CR513_01358, partial [Mucuna pruriens]